MTLKAIYKCRLCGKTYHSGQATSASTAEECMILMVAGVKGVLTWAPTTNDAHRCDDGSLGLSDFLGWKAEEET